MQQTLQFIAGVLVVGIGFLLAGLLVIANKIKHGNDLEADWQAQDRREQRENSPTWMERYEQQRKVNDELRAERDAAIVKMADHGYQKSVQQMYQETIGGLRGFDPGKWQRDVSQEVKQPKHIGPWKSLTPDLGMETGWGRAMNLSNDLTNAHAKLLEMEHQRDQAEQNRNEWMRRHNSRVEENRIMQAKLQRAEAAETAVKKAYDDQQKEHTRLNKELLYAREQWQKRLDDKKALTAELEKRKQEPDHSEWSRSYELGQRRGQQDVIDRPDIYAKSKLVKVEELERVQRINEKLDAQWKDMAAQLQGARTRENGIQRIAELLRDDVLAATQQRDRETARANRFIQAADERTREIEVKNKHIEVLELELRTAKAQFDSLRGSSGWNDGYREGEAAMNKKWRAVLQTMTEQQEPMTADREMRGNDA